MGWTGGVFESRYSAGAWHEVRGWVVAEVVL